MKAILYKLFLPALIVLFAPSVFAQERVIDNAGLLSAQEKAELSKLTATAAASYNFDLVIVTEIDIGGADPMEYADDFFDYKGYGLGQDGDGCLFLLALGSRDYWFSTSGRGIKILNSTAYGKLEGGAVKLLKEGNYYGAFRSFLLDWDEFLALDAKGRSYNFFYRWNLVLVCAAWLLSLAAGFIVVQAWKNGMNTALPQTQAAAYVVPGSLAFNVKSESFLYSKVDKIQRQSQAASSGGRVHTGSSGRSHGGGGGKF